MRILRQAYSFHVTVEMLDGIRTARTSMAPESEGDAGRECERPDDGYAYEDIGHAAAPISRFRRLI